MKKTYKNQKFLFILNIFCFITYFVKADETIEFFLKVKPGEQQLHSTYDTNFNSVKVIGDQTNIEYYT